jgi:DNA-directed RNA polymerase subunit E'/Rpb7
MKTIEEIDGVLRDCVGTCVYNVEYDALVCRIFEKEVLRGQVWPTSQRPFALDLY